MVLKHDFQKLFFTFIFETSSELRLLVDCSVPHQRMLTYPAEKSGWVLRLGSGKIFLVFWFFNKPPSSHA